MTNRHLDTNYLLRESGARILSEGGARALYTAATRTISDATMMLESGSSPFTQDDATHSHQIIFLLDDYKVYYGYVDTFISVSSVTLIEDYGELPEADGDILQMAILATERPAYEGYCEQDGLAEGDIMPGLIEIEPFKQITSKDGVNINQSVIDDAIQGADSLIDSYCGPRYTVPFTPVPNRIKDLSRKLAAYNLYERRASLGMPDTVRNYYEDAISFLKDVAASRASIDGAVKPTANTTTGGGSFQANDRVFSKEELDLL